MKKQNNFIILQVLRVIKFQKKVQWQQILYGNNLFLEFSKDELANIASVLDDNKSTIRKLRPEEGAFLDFEGVGTPDYIVDNNNLLGYIDL